ncbi:excalibur calcium-binding domain-containing protein [Saccharothrix sp. S26]|uniref:excalibur calcium-binding domain-containing protein n=1 Tax=Saccharothrix sp. S26 TaxID=2907215 RepID=UPI001F18FEF4|nr:excalibur calcium-binding domain-containing protein [Saccharothrix sp. S26]MCE6995796.1 excalibur calcium-binding domain-containing protein [Saccharothrix sp. S26]
MSSGRGVAFAGVALLLATGALVTLALTVDDPRPVDVRQVQLSPVEPGVLSATYTTTLEIARPTTVLVVVPPPEPRPVPPITTTTTVAVTTTSEPPAPPSAPESSTSTTPSWGENCDHSYVTEGPCVPWRFPRGVRRFCEWLREQGTTRIEVVGWDRHYLDRDRDGIACERAD